MRTFNTMIELRADSNYVANEVIYLKGYHFPNRLGGGGHFVYDENDLDPDDKGMTIIPNIPGSSLAGRWKRVNFEDIDVRFFGAKGTGTPTVDDTEAIQGAIDYVAANGGTVFIPSGTYYVSSLIIKDKVLIRGEFAKSFIRPYTVAPFSAVGENLIEIDSGTVRSVSIRDLFFDGKIDSRDKNGDIVMENNEPVKIDAVMNCIGIVAKPGGQNAKGGLWESTFRNIRIFNFHNDGMTFVGGSMNNNLPNQFITLENVRIIKSPFNSNSRALFMYGSNGQFKFNNCSFFGPQGKDSQGVNFPRVGLLLELRGVTAPKTGFRTGPSLINFDTCTFQEAELAIQINTCYSINITGCWFENLKNSILVVNRSLGVSISKNRFSNASNFGIVEPPGSGEYILSTNSSSTSFVDNLILGRYTNNGQTSGSGGTVLINPNNIEYYFGQHNFRVYHNPGQPPLIPPTLDDIIFS